MILVHRTPHDSSKSFIPVRTACGGTAWISFCSLLFTRARTKKPSWKESVLEKNDFPVQETCWCPGLLVIKEGCKVWRRMCTVQALERLVGFQHFMDGRSWELFMRGEKTYHESSTWRLAVPARKYPMALHSLSVGLCQTRSSHTQQDLIVWNQHCQVHGCQAPSSWNCIIIVK